jgi:hypothetical protein
MAAKVTYYAVWNGETYTRLTARTYTHAAVYRNSAGEEFVGSFHGSAAAAAKGSNGIKPIAVVETSTTEPTPEPAPAETEEAPAEPVANVVSYNGGKVHTMMPGQEEHPYPLCRGGGMNQNLTKFRATDAPLTCKTCVTYEERREAAKGESMTDTTGRIYGLLGNTNETTGGTYAESLPLNDPADFEGAARSLLGDRTEVTSAELNGCNWAELLRDVRADDGWVSPVPAWALNFRATLGPLSRETFDRAHPEWF